MWLIRVRRAWFGSRKSFPIVNPSRREAKAVRPSLEFLEDRVTPSIIQVTTVSDALMHSGTSLRDAIAQANTDAGNGTSDTIEFSGLNPGAVITLAQGAVELSGTDGSTVVPIDIVGGKQVTVSGNNASLVFQIDTGVNALLSGLTITGASGTIGGGIDNLGTLTVSGSTLSGNTAALGGGIYNDGSLTVSNSTLNDNTGTIGGGIYNNGPLTVSNSTFSGNSAALGGGIYNLAGLTVSASTLSTNTADDLGGAIDNQGTTTVSDSLVTANSAFQGGGIYNKGTSTVADSTLSANSANMGGAIFNKTTLVLSDDTVTSNTADATGGGIYSLDTLTLESTIVAGNTATGSDADVFSTVAGSDNLVGSSAGLSGISNDNNGNIVGVEPDLTALGNYGGPTQTYALQSGSPALNAGGSITTLTSAISSSDTTLSVADAGAIASTPGSYVIMIGSEQMLVTAVDLTNNTVTVERGYNNTSAGADSAGAAVFFAKDQRGLARVVDGAADIGAFQTQSALTVTTNADPGGIFGDLSLREAINLANNLTGGASIIFASSLEGATVTLTQGKLELTNTSGAVSISGYGYNYLNANNASSVFQIDSGVQASLSAFEIENGSATMGGGILNSGTLTLEDVELIDNSATNGGGIANTGTLTVNYSFFSSNTANSDGGAIYNNGGTLTLSNTTLGDNSAADGAALSNSGTATIATANVTNNTATTVNGGAVDNSGALTVDESTLSGNSANSLGGALYNSGTTTLIDSTLSDNNAEQGGGVYNVGILYVTSSTISGNTADSSGGGIRTIGGHTVTLQSTIVSDNTASVFGPDFYGQASGSNNLIGTTDASFSGLSNGENGNIIGTDPELTPLNNYGGPTQTFALLPTSSAVAAGGPATTLTDAIGTTDTVLQVGNVLTLTSTDSQFEIQIDGEIMTVTAVDFADNTLTVDRGDGDSTPAAHSAGAGVGLVTDQRGLDRVVNGLQDIGAFQTQTDPYLVTTPADPGLEFGYLALREAINLANAEPGSHAITFDLGNYYYNNSYPTIYLGQVLELTNTTGTQSIDGGSQVVISGYYGDTQVFEIDAGVEAVITNLSIENGSGGSGGGVVNDGTLTLSNVSLSGNHASSSNGGALQNNGTLTAYNVTFADNSASGSTSKGGAINNNGTMTLGNVTLSGNSAYDGGAISNFGVLTISDATIANNSAAVSGGGIYAPSSATLLNSIIAGNSASSSTDIYGSVSGSYNLVGSGGVSGITNGINNNIVGQPAQLTSLGNYGGYNQTLALLPTSPGLGVGGALTELSDGIGLSDTTISVANASAIASTSGAYVIQIGSEEMLVTSVNLVENTLNVVRGYNDTTPAIHAIDSPVSYATDERGLPRIVNGLEDIGPFQTQAYPLLVTTTADPGQFGQMSLRDAVNLANVLPGDETIDFAASLDGATISLVRGSLELNSQNGIKAIDGNGQITIGDNTYNQQIFVIDSGAQAVLAGLVLEDADVNGTNGGAVANNGTLTLLNDVLKDNSTNQDGGALYNAGVATIENTTLESNSATGTGGAIFNTGAMTVSDSTVSDNTASSGGALENSDGHVTARNSSFFNNEAEQNGGAIDNDGSTTLSNVTISGNEANAGNGIYNSGTLTLQCSLLADNGPAVAGSAVNSASAHNLIDNGTGLSGISNDDANGNIVGVDNVLLTEPGNYGGPTQTAALLPGSPALAAGGALTTLTAPVTILDTVLHVADASTIASTPGNYDIEIGGEVMVVTSVNLVNNTLTVTRLDPVSHASGIGVYYATDQRGADRPLGGAPDIGAFQSQGFTLTVDSGSSPQSTRLNSSFADPLGVTVTANNPLEPVDGGVITFAVQTGLDSQAANLSGSTATITDGQASVTAIANDFAGSYTVTASAAGQNQTATFDLTNYSDSLAVTQVPTSVVSGNVFTLVITAQNIDSETDTSFNGTVTVSLASGPGTLGGTLSVAAVDGVATFGNLTLDHFGTYTIHASADGLTGVTTDNIQVTTNHLVVTTAPASVTVNHTFTVEVSAEDILDNVDTTYGGTVSVALAGGPGNLGGTLSQAASDGVAAFANLTLDAAGTYTIRASASSLTSGTSAGILANTPHPPPTVSISGTVFTDFNNNGTLDPGEPGLGGIVVFLDLHNSGHLDPGDPSITTAPNDPYLFTGLTPGSYTVREVTQYPNVVVTGAGSSRVVDASSNVTGINFGNVVYSVAYPVYPQADLFVPHPNADANTAYVRGLYQTILDRPAEPGGLANWVLDLRSGQMTPAQVATAIFNSQEHRQDEVDSYYEQFLGRAADPGSAHWVDMLENGGTEQQVIEGIMTSPEYTAAHASNATFVNSLYFTLLGRQADSGGVAFWLQQLDNGKSRAAVIDGFLFSSESATLAVNSFYSAFLHRAGDSASVASWVSSLTRKSSTIDQVVIEFLSSPEFLSDAAHGVP